MISLTYSSRGNEAVMACETVRIAATCGISVISKDQREEHAKSVALIID